ncbi:hydroxyacylglutathione hydrolase [Acidiphilium sp. AL]|uniref:Hydroxyacylglutathione hydrolase n=1 Tax=Acidiphilium iwatense TaxID=768198 RepID=A0ABS9DYQ8_9PROT|nr:MULTISPECIES: hydroxyacylglutathione hydrolase [Acidiphilium]MCF3947880.1 hydroxyacylglutathione hydrolase [Acidiphilium iwatense]MCU4160025.1 hydroxyacylglutathione hydrolase [Acidiphilium sp. AL]
MTIAHSGFTVIRVPMLADNYAWLVSRQGVAAFIDPADAGAAIDAVERSGGRLDFVLLTHHHDDHIAGAASLAARFGAKLIGNAADAARLPKLGIALNDGDTLDFGGATLRMIATSGHTIGHVTYLFGDAIAACGDTLFSLGCGRMFEGTPAMFQSSLQRIATLDPGIMLLCGHEYTLANARFARSVDPDNEVLAARATEVERLRRENQPTLPVLLADELLANPFLRAQTAEEFARLRAAKDNFR